MGFIGYRAWRGRRTAGIKQMKGGVSGMSTSGSGPVFVSPTKSSALACGGRSRSDGVKVAGWRPWAWNGTHRKEH